jgi:hypothetical protein
MTAKEYIEKMIDNFERQGCFAIVSPEVPKCMYRTNNGLKCIIGQGINDTLYEESLENHCIKSDLVLHRINSSFIESGGNGTLPHALLESLQSIHDSEYHQERVKFEDVVTIMREVTATFLGGRK